MIWVILRKVRNLSLQFLPMLLLAPLTQHLDLHSYLEERKWLREVANAELIFCILARSRIFDLEVKPLLVTLRV